MTLGVKDMKENLIERYDAIIQELSKMGDSRELETDPSRQSAPHQSQSASQDLVAQSVHCAKLLQKALRHSERYNRIEKLLSCEDDAAMQDELGSWNSGDQKDVNQQDDTLNELIENSEKLDQLATSVERALCESVASHSDLHLDTADDLLHLSSPGENVSEDTDNPFRDLYTETFVSAFGDDLDQFRKHKDFTEKDVNYLISCIQAGADIFTAGQKEFFVSKPK